MNNYRMRRDLPLYMVQVCFEGLKNVTRAHVRAHISAGYATNC